jgi:hypothetical protein
MLQCERVRGRIEHPLSLFHDRKDTSIMASEYLTVEHLRRELLIRIFFRVTIHPDLQHNGTPCWIWSGYLDPKGYGHIGFDRTYFSTHRLMFAWLVHPIPKGKEHGEIDHLCRRPACCSPLHLEFVSGRVNRERSDFPPSKNSRKTRCLRGHPLAGGNLFINSAGGRVCRICVRETYGRWRIKNRQHYLAQAAKRTCSP